MTINDLKKVQSIGLELLLAVDDICRKNGIQYMLFYGTLLGAVRHGGAIPWDDDVDIAMTRKNYLRFIEVARPSLDADKYNLKIMGSGSTDYISEVKIGKKGTYYCTPGFENFDIMNQVNLDIFCLELVKENSWLPLNMRWKLWKMLILCKLNKDEKKALSYHIDKSSHSNKWFFKTMLWIAHSIRAIIGEKNFEKIGAMLMTTSESKNLISLTSPYCVTYKTSWVDATVDISYEGHLLKAPVGYKEVLKTTYGDYMQLPPEDKRYRKDLDLVLFREA